MLERVGLLVLFLCVLSKAIASDGESAPHQPAVAMFCGKVTRHKDLNTGDWITGSSDQDCIADKEEILNYCKKVYPKLDITNVVEESETVHVPSWCRLGSQPPCRGHGHNVKPFKCIVGQYAAEALDVVEGCSFEHKVDESACHAPSYWESEAAKYCLVKQKTFLKRQMLTPCPGVVDQWKGIQFLCCAPPDVSKPKPSKGKGVPLSPTNVNVICLQPKRVGLCRAMTPAWHYNTDSGECEFFYYGGCDGNENNFGSKEDCMSTCIPKGPTVDDPQDDISFCGLAPETGPCRALFRNFYYDPVDKECKSFVFGGCNGNKNNFQMKADCEEKCKGYKKPLPDTIQVEPPISLPIMNLGPVILEDESKKTQPVSSEESPTTTITTTTSTSSTPFYTDKTTIKDEHQVFANKMEEIKSDHQAKVNAILAKWDEDNARLSPQDRQHVEQLEEELQETITALEDEYDKKMNSLNNFHMERMDRIVDEERGKALQKFLDQLNADKPKLRHILTALEKYISVERQDKTHIMEHYAMAMRDDFNKDSVQDFRSRIDNIEARVNKTRTVMMSYPDIMRHIQDEVEEILATMPRSPDFEYDEKEDDGDDDLPEEEIVEIPDMDEEIDDGGIPDPDLCNLPPVVGLCRASITAYYFDSKLGRCSTFTYGGCGGNDNNFLTMKECEAACPGKPKAEKTCSLPPAVGFCRAALPRYYYDAVAGECKSFTYGGCGGNENRYLTLKECNTACAGKEVDPDMVEVFDNFGDFFPDTTTDDNSILSSFDGDDDDEEEMEDETKLDEDVDRQFNFYGDRIVDVRVNDDPQALVSDVKGASVASSWPVWIGLAVAAVFIAAVVAVIVIRRNQTLRPPMTIGVDKPAEESDKETSSEEKQLLDLQQNGYENPTFKFFEKRQMA